MGQIVTETMNVPEGTVLDYSYSEANGNQAALFFGDPNIPGAGPTLINHGEMRFTDLSAFNFDTFIQFSSAGSWIDVALENYGLISAINPNSPLVYAIKAGSSSPDLFNAGSIIAEAQGQAIAFSTYESINLTVTNTSTGTIRATGGLSAHTLELNNGGTVSNDGEIIAQGGANGAVAVWFQNGKGTVHNAGLISATDTDAATNLAVAIQYRDVDMTEIVNDGIIRGDYAIQETTFSGGSTPLDAAILVRNNNLIEGRIYLGDGDDVLENNGHIAGDVELGNENDTYNGQLGTFVGTVFGGAGNDQLNGGAGAETFEGGTGADTIDGGGGIDIASYANSASEVFITLGSGALPGVAAGGDATGDTLSGIEGLIGSAFNDQMFGMGTGVLLFGQGGNDILRGEDPFSAAGGGADTIDGGDGDDYMNGGSGADTYDGGTGIDRVSFFAAAATQGAVANLITQVISNDGFGNAETMSGVEGLGAGTAFADTFTGNDSANELLAGTDDTVLGNGGDDTFFVSGRAAFLDGGSGIDTITFTGDAGNLFQDSNSDGLGEFVLATHGVVVEMETGWIADDGFGFSGIGGQFVGFENLTGSNLDDTLSGDASANRISGRNGTDSIFGGGGADNLFGDDGNDVVFGGAGGDAIDGGAGQDTAAYDGSAAVSVDLQSGVASGGDAAGDVLTSIENIVGSAFNDSLAGDSGINYLRGLGGNDFIQGRGGDDLIIGEDGDDWLDGGAGGDNIDGGAGDDVAAYGASATAVNLDLQSGVYSGGDAAGDVLSGIEGLSGSGFNDSLFGDASANRLFGQGGNDFIQGRGGADIIQGGNGDDWLDGGAGADTVDGGAGTADIAAYGASTSAVSLDLQSFAYSGGDAAGDVLSGIEGLSGSGFNDSLFGNASANRLFGQGGNDFIQGRGGADIIQGGNGDDWLDGGTGGDTVDGGAGTADVAAYGASASAVSLDLQSGVYSGGDAAGDVLTGIEGLSGSGFNDSLFGNASANRLFGQNGNDFIQGRAGVDTIAGGDGDDWLDGGAGGDSIDGGNGAADVAAYGASTAAVSLDLQSGAYSGGDAAGDVLTGIEGLSGSALNDSLFGDASANRLFGQGGADTLGGRGGDDQLTGGNGDDIFVFADNGAVDRVNDFDDFGDDLIQLSIGGVTSFNDVAAVMTQVGADVFIDFATTDILLVNTTLATVQADDFAFV